MQNDKADPNQHLDPKAVPAAHDEINRPGMTNGVPDQLNDAEASGRPRSDRQKSEGAAGAKSGSGS